VLVLTELIDVVGFNVPLNTL